ncbi:hypothetical protein SAMN02910447_01853 [Ruminococcus sp. YE71]|uniref:hypothetical protein n=1 Tax=unclassified Ruminococcus TaxID=2608920 RepID=UPI00088B73FB|nr:MULTISPECIES: hypothetical protein [unclassified Ruminococcus]SDA20872.1 hypothetical protein SAMN02910446_01817 [Ruminococcus sp. YE78]SFW33464.1 hypothetical protein SAMN02910447_01853 [Ruminococcus sp. YE71]
MINLIPGKKGTGKTKILVDAIVKASEEATGYVVCIERGMKLTYDIPSKVRLVDAEEFGITSYDAFYGFVAGLLAGNYDIQQIYVDGILRIGGRDYDALGAMLEKVSVLAKDVKLVFTVSADTEELPDKVKAFIH